MYMYKYFKTNNSHIQCMKTSDYLWDRGFLPGSVGGLQAPTNCMRSNLTQV